MSPRLVIGLPVYGDGEHLDEALETLLQQTFEDLAIVVVDDSPDAGAREHVARWTDPRISYAANERRLGLVGNWKRAFEVARERHPGAPYFAWGSDHDAWHPYWAARLVAALEACPEAVLAYPRTFRMSAEGTTLDTKDWSFDTRGITPASRRVRRVVRRMSAGNMVYGVYRADALARAGVFHHVLLPDRFLLSELALSGDLVQVDEPLFYRRVTATPSIERQRASFWPDGDLPWYARLPWTTQHVLGMWRRLVRGEAGPPGLALGERCGLAVAHTASTLRYSAGRFVGRLYFRAVGGRSVKAGIRARIGAVVEWLGDKTWGPAVLRNARRMVDALPLR